MTEKYIDFDAYRAEKKEEPLIVKAFGKKYELPPSPRMSLMEKLIEIRHKSGKEATIPEEEIVAMIRALIGEEEARELSEKGVTLKELEWLLKGIWKQYNSAGEEDDTKNPKESTSQKSGD